MNTARWFLILCLISVTSLMAGGEKKGKISGLLFGDFYWLAAHQDSSLEGRNGFWVRRIYFTYDKGFSDRLSMRFRLEMNSPGNFTSGNMTPFVKDAYLQWESGLTAILLGISSSPTFSLMEKVWGYRSVEKTPDDLQRIGPSREFGLAVKGALSSSKKVKYHLMVGNGAGSKSDGDKGKKAMLALSVYPTEQLLLEVYGDYNDLPGKRDVYTWQGFLAYQGNGARLGMQYTRQVRKQGAGNDVKVRLASLFAVVQAGAQLHLFARVDRMLDPNPDAGRIAYLPFFSAKNTLFIGGADVQIEKDVHLMPNVEWIVYDEVNGQRIDATIMPRLTFYYTF